MQRIFLFSEGARTFLGPWRLMLAQMIASLASSMHLAPPLRRSLASGICLNFLVFSAGSACIHFGSLSHLYYHSHISCAFYNCSKKIEVVGRVMSRSLSLARLLCAFSQKDLHSAVCGVPLPDFCCCNTVKCVPRIRLGQIIQSGVPPLCSN